jgi:single-stranded-DNA-specific exonuclease
MNYRWSIAPIQDLQVKRLSEEFDLSPLLAQCCSIEGTVILRKSKISCARNSRIFPILSLFPISKRAVDRLLTARELGQKVVVFGDYDVDGVTSTALIIEVLRELGWKIDFYLPHRLEEGYGLSQDGVENCLEKLKPDLILAVDCGSTAVDTIRWLKDRVDGCDRVGSSSSHRSRTRSLCAGKSTA